MVMFTLNMNLAILIKVLKLNIHYYWACFLRNENDGGQYICTMQVYLLLNAFK